MEKKINIAELLKDCPKGMELDCTMYENVKFDGIETGESFPIRIVIGGDEHEALTEFGRWNNSDNAKCVIFPKGKTTWEGFHRPFKDGDIRFTRTSGYAWVSIFKQFGRGVCRTYIDLCIDDNDWFIDTRCLCSIKEITTQRFATEEEKARLFQVIKDNGYKWNAETKTLEKLIQPKFKVGDKIREKGDEAAAFTISDIDDSCYYCGEYIICNICDQDDYELVPDKFDINNLVPFESRVLVRDYNYEKWFPSFWGCYDRESNCERPFITVGWLPYKQCIPYEGNEHLLCKTDDCIDFYRTWE